MIKMKKLICSLVLASGGLFITSLIPTKANAVSLTLAPVGTLEKKPGDAITFTISLDPMGSKIWFQKWTHFSYNSDELAIDNSLGAFAMEENTLLSGIEVIARVSFRVLEGVRKDGITDFSDAIVTYNRYDPTVFGEIVQETVVSEPNIIDVVPASEPVPEPLTIFGTATALGYGAILKRKPFKKTVS